MKPTMKAPGSKRLKLRYDGPLSTFAFNFNLRRYIESMPYPRYAGSVGDNELNLMGCSDLYEAAEASLFAITTDGQGLTLVHFSAQPQPLLSLKPPNVSHKKSYANRMGKMTHDINPKLKSNPKPRIDRVVWAK